MFSFFRSKLYTYLLVCFVFKNKSYHCQGYESNTRLIEKKQCVVFKLKRRRLFIHVLNWFLFQGDSGGPMVCDGKLVGITS